MFLFVLLDDCVTIVSPAIAALSRGLTLKTYDPGLRLIFDFVPMSTTDSLSEPGSDILVLLSPKSMTALTNEHKQKCINSSDTSSRDYMYNAIGSILDLNKFTYHGMGIGLPRAGPIYKTIFEDDECLFTIGRQHGLKCVCLQKK